MITEKQSPAGSAGQNEKPEGDTLLINSSKDSEFADNMQIEISIPEGTAIDRTVKFPLDGANSDIRQIAETISNVYQCPAEFVFMPMINALSIIAGNKIRLYDGKYTNTPMHWIGILAPSGSNKSKPVIFAMRPIEDINKQNYASFQSALQEWEESEDKGQKPIFKQILLSNTTPEARDKALGFNKNGICLYPKELAAKIQAVGRYSNGNSSELTDELVLWDGDDIPINRSGDDPKLLTDPFQSIVGTIQPPILVKNFGKDHIIDSGYIQRWLWIYPENIDYPDYIESKVPDNIKECWTSAVNALYDKVNSSDFEDIIVELKGDAKQLYIDYFNEIQSKKRDRKSDYENAIYSKLEIQCQRIALSLWIADFVFSEGKNITLEIPVETMKYSIDCMRYFEYTALKVKSLIDSKQFTQLEKTSNKSIILDIKKLHPQFNQSVLADILNVDRSYISNVVSGRK